MRKPVNCLRNVSVALGNLLLILVLLVGCGAPAPQSASVAAATQAPAAAPTEAPAAATEAPAAAATEAPAPSETEAASAPAEAGGKGTKLTLWINQADSDALKAMYERFQAETGYELEVVPFPQDGFERAVLTQWSTGDRPDILSWHGNYAQLLALNPKENLRELTNEAFIKRYVPGILEGRTEIDGVYYGVTVTFPVAFGLYYNKEIFDRLGLKPPSTAAELLKVCQDIKAADASVVPMFEAAGSGWPPDMFMGSFTGDAAKAGWIDDIRQRKAKFDDPDSPWIRALTFYDKMRDEGCFNKDVLTAEYEDSYKALLEGKAAMVSQHSLASVDAAEAFSPEEVNAKMGFQAWSETHPIVTAAIVPHGTYYLPKTGDPDREAGALAFLDFMTGPAYKDYLAKVGSVPVLQGVPIPDTVLTPLQEALQAVQEYGSIPPVWDYAPGIDIRIATGSVLADEKTPAEAAAQSQVEAAQGARAAGLPAWP